MNVRYRSNNSGGSWWLKDKDWTALEQAGWKVEWAKDEPNRSFIKDGRYMGALAVAASFECETPGDAMRSFEAATGQNVSDEGCNCCGAPHPFSWDGGYASGEGCLEYLYPDADRPKNLRDAIERGLSKEVP